MKSFVLFLALALQALAIDTFTQSVSSQTSITITAATHGLSSSKIAVSVYNSGGVLQPTNSYTPVVYTDKTVTVSWGSSFTGTVKLRAAFPGPDTEDAFKLGNSGSNVYVCQGATGSEYQRKTVSGVVHVCAAELQYTAAGSAQCAQTVTRVYVEHGKMYFAMYAPGGAGCHGSISGADTAHRELNTVNSEWDWPSGVLKIVTIKHYGTNVTDVIDERPW